MIVARSRSVGRDASPGITGGVNEPPSANAVLAVPLLVVVGPELVAGRCLVCQPRAGVAPLVVVEGGTVEVGLVGPLVDLRVVFVVPHVRNGVPRIERPERRVEPQTIADDAAAAGRIDIVHFDELVRWRRSGGVLQLLRVGSGLP